MAVLRWAAIATCTLASAIWLGCGGADREAEPAPTGPLAAALASIGGGGEHGSLGVGWAEPQRAAALGAAGVRLIADALGPNADSVVEARRALRRRFGLDPLAAERLVSVGGSYAFGLRLDGLRAPGLRRALLASGASERAATNSRLLDAAGYASVPQPLLDAGVNGLGARDAFGASTVLAISDTSRAALLGRGGRLLDQPIYRAAASCLQGSLAARLVPAKLVLSTELGFELVGIGVAPDRELLCVLGGSAANADEISEALRASLRPDAVEPRSGERIGERVASAEVTREEVDGVQVVRASLGPAHGSRPGFLFETIARGSLVGMLGVG